MINWNVSKGWLTGTVTIVDSSLDDEHESARSGFMLTITLSDETMNTNLQVADL